jgi:cobalt-zinc-cadmium efflux system outer membrane protein
VTVIKICCFSFAFLFVSLPAQAETVPTGSGFILPSSESSSVRTMAYPDAAKEMLQNNPDLSTVRSQEESLKFKSIQALAPNEPVFSFTKTDVPNPSIFSESGASVYDVAWTLGFPGKALANSRSLEHQAQALRETSFQKEIELLTTLSNVYVELSVNKSTIETLVEEQKRAAQTIFITQKRYSSAQAAQTDILNAKFYKTSVEHDILTQEAARDSLLIQFRTLLRQPEANIAPAITPDWENKVLDRNFDQLKTLMFDNRPQLKSVVYQKNAASSALTAAILSPFPDFQLNGAMNIYHVDNAAPVPGLNKSYTLGVGIVIPIFFPFNELSGIRSAKMDLSAAEFTEESARVNLISDLQNLYTKLESSRRLYKNTEEYVVPAAKANYTLSLKAFEIGRLDYLKLLDARKSWIQSQRDLLDHKKDLAEIVNSITLEVGCDWSRKGVPHACD